MSWYIPFPQTSYPHSSLIFICWWLNNLASSSLLSLELSPRISIWWSLYISYSLWKPLLLLCLGLRSLGHGSPSLLSLRAFWKFWEKWVPLRNVCHWRGNHKMAAIWFCGKKKRRLQTRHASVTKAIISEPVSPTDSCVLLKHILIQWNGIKTGLAFCFIEEARDTSGSRSLVHCYYSKGYRGRMEEQFGIWCKPEMMLLCQPKSHKVDLNLFLKKCT